MRERIELPSEESIIAVARETIATEALAIEALGALVDDHFAAVVHALLTMEGRAVVTGIGKSAIIGQKIVATLNSTGTPAVFMHAADAIHGDLGMIQPGDVVICLSKSGATPEIKVLVPLIKMMGNRLVALVSNGESYLAQQADWVLRATVSHEACPNNLAPTSSTTAQLVVGDALAVCLLKARGFTPEDFARYHPGGSLGKRLYLRVCDIMNPDVRPQVLVDDSLERVIVAITSGRLGATAVTAPTGQLVGIITDGDLRRMLQKTHSMAGTTAREIMSTAPRSIAYDALAVEAFRQMEANKITQLVVMQGDEYRGMIHIHDLLREGIIG